MSLALIITDRNCDSLVDELKRLDSGLEIQVWPHIQNPEKVKFAVLWKQPENYLNKFPHLKAVTSLGAGTDFIESDPCLSSNVPIHRIVTEGLQQQMAQYVLSYLLADYRNHSKYAHQQFQKQWVIHELQGRYQVGFLGLGKIGEFVARQIQALGFEVQAWTQSSNCSDIHCYHGHKGLQQLLSESDCVVSLLPLTKATKNLFDIKCFKQFKSDSLFIQVGRGGQVVEKDLIEALDSGLLRKAIMDVFATEPLPEDSPLWSHPQVVVTPHNSARSDSKQTAKEVKKLFDAVMS